MLNTYQVLSIIFEFGSFIMTLLIYIDKHNKK